MEPWNKRAGRGAGGTAAVTFSNDIALPVCSRKRHSSKSLRKALRQQGKEGDTDTKPKTRTGAGQSSGDVK